MFLNMRVMKRSPNYFRSWIRPGLHEAEIRPATRKLTRHITITLVDLDNIRGYANVGLWITLLSVSFLCKIVYKK